ncbi:CRIB domain-containing protein RIC7-like [Vigna radiata var. radiata]|uniref:CRIB domain-containing protein RIC7-like n=1 Tax=Vigna radiata var. radiata TaxID=3916 RepID=A0A1S3V0D2_VIGRR|nr:CRIB domain-containing protein RIC7-like [Vigna radiata var. radiata]
MSGGKVKGILKGFRYFTQIFESEKEQDIQIGFPTDVKHVAHIGWDGPSVNSPSWMNEFKTSPTVDVHNKGLENGAKRVAEESRRKNLRGSSDLPKASKRQSTGVTDSPSREKTSKPRTRKTSHKNKDEIAHSPRIPEYPDPFQLPPSLPSPDNNNIPKKSRRHKTKDNSGGVPSKLRTKAHSGSDPGSPAQPKSRNTHTTFDETEHDLLL